MMAPLVVIGAGLAGWTAVREFRKLDTTTPVLLVTADSGDFYAKPSLSNAFSQGKLPAQLVSTPADKMAATLGVTLLCPKRPAARCRRPCRRWACAFTGAAPYAPSTRRQRAQTH